MKRVAWFAHLLWACLLWTALVVPGAQAAEDVAAHGHFEQVRLYRPTGPTRQFVLFLSGPKGWTATDARQAALLATHGAMVAGVDTTHFQGRFTIAQLQFGDLENLAHYVQGYARLDTYHTPFLAAPASAWASAKLMKGKPPADVFAGILAVGDAKKLLTAYDSLAAANVPELPPPPRTLNDLPIVEELQTGPATTGAAKDTFAIFMSGDGGWAGLDKQVASALTAQGVPVVGVDSLRYFWSRRTPEGLAADLDRIERYYAAHWNRHRVLLVGYSQGANALPAAYNRLPGPSHRMVRQLVLIGLENRVAWQFHLSNWISSPGDAQPIQPEAVKLTAARTLCLYGDGDGDALCPKLPATSVTAEEMPGGHHFNGAYDQLAARILARLN